MIRKLNLDIYTKASVLHRKKKQFTSISQYILALVFTEYNLRY